jgi:NAD(P)-dependent dehydrogenase (short-subunit alcohol dehydrogenase family)
MRAAGGGSIVNTASVAGLYATPYVVAYGASKHAVIGMTRTAAIEVAGDGITVNAICPGPLESRMMESIEAGVAPADPAGARSRYMAAIPMGRYGSAEEIAEAAAWLLTAAPRYLTGQTLVVDGGLLAV